MTTTINGTTGIDKVADGSITQAKLAPNVVGNGPAFRAYTSGTMSVSITPTKIQLGAEDYDTSNAFDTATGRFTPTVAGYYSFIASCAYTTASSVVQCRLAKNGFAVSIGGSGVASAQAVVSDLIYMNGTTDYVELFGYSVTTQNVIAGITQTYLAGFLARAA